MPPPHPPLKPVLRQIFRNFPPPPKFKIITMAKKILLTSFKGGTGVTAFAVGLGLALASMGERTLIVDGDAVTGCATITGECRDMIVYTLADYEKGACRAKQTIIPHPKESNLAFMPGIGVNDLSYVGRAVNDVDGLFDYVLLDKTAQNVCSAAFIVTEPFPPSIKSADACRSFLNDGGIKDLRLVVNKLSACQILNGETMTAHEISALLRTPLAAVIPEDLTLSTGGCKKSTAKAFKTAAASLTGKRDEIYNVLRGMRGINGYIKRKMRNKI